MSKYRKKLIEVALPLDVISRESAREKSIRHGHPSTLHLWWARRPLAACRAVLFGQLVDDPSAWPERFLTEADQDRERQRLFRILEELVQWENSNNTVVLAWTHSMPDFVLQSTSTLSPPAWASAGLPVTLTADQNTAVDTVVGAPKFYRLARP